MYFFVFLYVLFIVEEAGRHGLLSSIFLATDSELNSREKKKGKEQTDVLQKSNKVRITLDTCMTRLPTPLYTCTEACCLAVYTPRSCHLGTVKLYTTSLRFTAQNFFVFPMACLIFFLSPF